MKDHQLLQDARRLTTPRAFEPDYARHLERIADDDAARARLHAAGYYCHPDYLRAIQELRRDIANCCEPDDARTVPFDTGLVHGPREADGSPPRGANWKRVPYDAWAMAVLVHTIPVDNGRGEGSK